LRYGPRYLALVKKVLIITRWYPPYPYPSFRIVGLAKYLPEFGWEPIILTSSLGKVSLQCRVIETPYRDVLAFWKRLFGLAPDKQIRRQINDRLGVSYQNRLVDFVCTRIGELVNYPDQDRGWKPFAVRAGSELLQKEAVDAVLSSSMPIISHLIARELKKRYQIPWLADFRDLWTQNSNYSYSPLRKLIDHRLELKTLSSADALVIISQPATEKLAELHRGKTVYTITNGFDPVEINSPSAGLTTKFTITHTGSIYPRGQEPSKFFAAVRALISDGTIKPDDIEVRFYGPQESWVEKEISNEGLSDTIRQNGIVPREAALEKQRESQLLLLFKWEDPEERGGYTGKVFEYLAARRPILATGGFSDVVDQLLSETGAGICAPTVESIKSALKKFYQEYKLKGEIAYQGQDAEVNNYSHREMAGKFADILNKLV
jgi:glycosyltransferase involved in cell wall biosynthesis